MKRKRKSNNTVKTIIFVCIFVCCGLTGFSQEKYFVKFRDKKGSQFNPEKYFDRHALDQRRIWKIETDSLDFPVSEKYIQEICSSGAIATTKSRWLNGVYVFATTEQERTIKEMSCVAEIIHIKSGARLASCDEVSKSHLSKQDSALLIYQTARLQAEKFRDKKIDGKGVRIAVFDGGFPRVDKSCVYHHLFKNNQIKETFDFTRNKKDVFRNHMHGSATLSCLAGMAGNIPMGLAAGADYYLVRTEKVFGESLSEEEYWVAAAEWANQHGVNIISSSLGYTLERYFEHDMTGSVALVSRAAGIAAAKGMLVVNAAGNDGDTDWQRLCAPADNDSVLSVGGTDPYTDAHMSFSSFGPNAIGHLKPNVSAPAQAIVCNGKRLLPEFGTSFSTPLVAGFAACVWQMHPEWNNMQVLYAIENSGHLYPYFDFAHGYGIPQAGYFTDSTKEKTPTFYFSTINNNINVSIDDSFGYNESSDDSTVATNKQIRNLYYKIEDIRGVMRSYTAIVVDKKQPLNFSELNFQNGDKITVHFEGYTSAYIIPMDTPVENKQ